MNPTPEEFKKLREDVDTIIKWMNDRKTQQISYPLDEASKNAMGVATLVGPGGHALTQTKTDSGGDTVVVPAAYTGTIILLIDGAQYEIPRL